MRISMRKQRRAAGRPTGLCQTYDASAAINRKAGAPTPQKGVLYAVDVLSINAMQTLSRRVYSSTTVPATMRLAAI